MGKRQGAGFPRTAAEERDLALPFFEPRHAQLRHAVDGWAATTLPGVLAAVAQPLGGASTNGERSRTDAACRALVRALGDAGFLRYCVPAPWGGEREQLESRSLCLIRETLARHDGLADFAFAMQGLGSGPISLGGSDSLRARYLPPVARGEAIAAFALSEPDAGSDAAAMTTRARRVLDDRGEAWLIDGCKTWISNGGIADFYCVFARTGEEPGARGISAFVVDAATPGLEIAERIDVIAPHPLATLRLRECRVPLDRLLGDEGRGFGLAMATLDIFRASVAGAALGLARRALDEALHRARSRRMFGQALADFQLTQAALAEMATAIDASMLLTARAAWQRDALVGLVPGHPAQPEARATREAAMAKMVATEEAQRVIDRALQMFGGLGVKQGETIERLYREIRALRIYEGATEVQKLIIARELLKN